MVVGGWGGFWDGPQKSGAQRNYPKRCHAGLNYVPPKMLFFKIRQKNYNNKRNRSQTCTYHYKKRCSKTNVYRFRQERISSWLNLITTQTTHTHTRVRTHARTHRMHARTHAQTHTHTQPLLPKHVAMISNFIFPQSPTVNTVFS